MSNFARSSLGYPVTSPGLQNTTDARASNHLSSRVLTRYHSCFCFFCHWLFTGLVYTNTIIPVQRQSRCQIARGHWHAQTSVSSGYRTKRGSHKWKPEYLELLTDTTTRYLTSQRRWQGWLHTALSLERRSDPRGCWAGLHKWPMIGQDFLDGFWQFWRYLTAQINEREVRTVRIAVQPAGTFQKLVAFRIRRHRFAFQHT